MPKSSAKKPVKVPQEHGGALQRGGTPGNPGGGRPPAELRRILRLALEERVEAIKDIADNGAPKDRLKALDLMARYGMGVQKEVTTEHVRERLAQSIEVIREEVEPEVAERVLKRMSKLWR